MRMTLTYPLYRRKDASNESMAVGYFDEGVCIEVADVVLGKPIDGNSIWYRADEGLFYWSGGFEEVMFKTEVVSFDKLSTEEKWKLLAEAKTFYVNRYQNKLPGITGAYIGNKTISDKKTEHPCLIIQVEDKENPAPGQPEIPDKLLFKGFEIPTKVVEAELSDLQWVYPGLDNPRKLGGSISRMDTDNWGTCGVKVEGTTDENAGFYLLTNYHVAAHDLLAKQQFDYWSGDDEEFKECVMPAWKSQINNDNIIGFLYQGRFSNWHDVALIFLYKPERVSNFTTANKQVTDYINVFNEPKFQGATVDLYGSFSGKKSGRIISVNSSQFFKINGVKYRKEDLIQMERISQGGDSGSLVLLDDLLIGILLGADNTATYVIPIERILHFFNLKIAKA